MAGAGPELAEVFSGMSHDGSSVARVVGLTALCRVFWGPRSSGLPTLHLLLDPCGGRVVHWLPAQLAACSPFSTR